MPLLNQKRFLIFMVHEHTDNNSVLNMIKIPFMLYAKNVLS